MTRRTIFAGTTPTVIIKSSAGVAVVGWDSDQVQAESNGRGGLKVETRAEAEIGRAKVALGDHVLFDVRLKLPGDAEKTVPGEAIEVQIGREGKVRVPQGSRVKVFAGKGVQVSDMRGTAAIYAGGDVRVRNVHSLANIITGGAIDLECETIEGQAARFEAGRDLRCYVRDLTSARILVSDLGGAWEGMIGSGEVTLRLKAGCDVTLVTDQKVTPTPPNGPLGQIESPPPP